MAAMMTTQFLYCEIIGIAYRVQQLYRYYQFISDMVFLYIYVNKRPLPSNLDIFNAKS